MSSRIDVFKMMLASDPDNTAVLFGLAKEYEKAGLYDEVIETLNEYLLRADDEGNAYGMLASAYERTGKRDAARLAYERGIEVAQVHDHPSMAQDYRLTLETEYDE